MKLDMFEIIVKQYTKWWMLELSIIVLVILFGVVFTWCAIQKVLIDRSQGIDGMFLMVRSLLRRVFDMMPGNRQYQLELF